MKSIFKTYLFIVFLGMVANACISVPEPSPDSEGQKLVLNAFWQPDSTPELQLSRSFGLLESPEAREVSGAKIQLLENGIPISQYIEATKGRYLPASGVAIKSGYVYTLLMEWQDFAPVQAAVQIPGAPDWQWLDSSGNEETLSLLSRLKDAPGEHFYLLRLRREGIRYLRNAQNQITDSVPETQDLPFEINLNTALSLNLLRIDGGSEALALFSDRSFDGRSWIVSTSIERSLLHSNPDFRTVQIEMELQSISRDYYLYLESALKNVPVYGLFTGNAVNVHSNVRNGLGILAGFHAARITLSL